jgi:hypothetical protein
MNSIVFDSGPLISLTLNNLLWILEPLKGRFGGKFYITEAVKKEIIDHPLQTKRFKYEAFQLIKLLKDGVIELYESPTLHEHSSTLMENANSIYALKGQRLKMFHYAEMSVLAACLELDSSAAAIDEKMTRILLENPSRIIEIIRKRMHEKTYVDNIRLNSVRSQLKSLKVLRSTELAIAAYERGLMHDYVAGPQFVEHPKQELLEAVLWGLKLAGCAIAEKEINQIIKIESNQ